MYPWHHLVMALSLTNNDDIDTNGSVNNSSEIGVLKLTSRHQPCYIFLSFPIKLGITVPSNHSFVGQLVTIKCQSLHSAKIISKCLLLISNSAS